MQVESSLAACKPRQLECSDLASQACRRPSRCRPVRQALRALLGFVIAIASSSATWAQVSEIVSDQCTPLTLLFGGPNGDIQLWKVGDVTRTQVVITVSQGSVRGEVVYTDYQRLSWVPSIMGYQLNGGCRIIEARYYNFAPGPSMGGEFAASSESGLSRKEKIVKRAVRRFILENQNYTPNDGSQCGSLGFSFLGKCRYPFAPRYTPPPCAPNCPPTPAGGGGVRGSMDLGGGGWLTTASPASLTFHTDVSVGESDTYIPFLIDRAGDGDAITIYGANGAPVWTKYLADLTPGELYFAVIPRQQLATAGLPILTIWLHGTGTSPSRVLFPDAVDFWDPPLVDLTVGGFRGSNEWYVGDVIVSWSVSDPQGLPITSRSGCDPTTIAFDTPGLEVACSVTTEVGEARVAITIKRDATAPSISISTPNGQTVAQGAPLVAAYTCADALSGLQTCIGTVANGSPLDTTTLGIRTLVVTASDAAGNTASRSLTYTVVPADSDGDGVSDSLDQCPGTPAGAAVGANGCPVSQPTARCDVNRDNLVDYRDIRSIVLGIGKPATGITDSRDANGNGKIDVIDAAICTSKCNRVFCLPPK
ncbi:MAG: hypothetical protein KA766_01270 [Piscinibacter sp.]|uniref:hypothetical protein n=1 Tax=Piscinibacter sp. TaxID=1903157 RepID=UPI001B7972AD|nr:hypothetical protein [Piscinibacter sp.]MBP5988631.1 hypothetical protein [Piscinibacter sp.]MBP6025880.1 hypothetical protein [Piscinibacter sp.]